MHVHVHLPGCCDSQSPAPASEKWCSPLPESWCLVRCDRSASSCCCCDSPLTQALGAAHANGKVSDSFTSLQGGSGRHKGSHDGHLIVSEAVLKVIDAQELNRIYVRRHAPACALSVKLRQLTRPKFEWAVAVRERPTALVKLQLGQDTHACQSAATRLLAGKAGAKGAVCETALA